MKLLVNPPQIRLLGHSFNYLSDWSQATPLRGHWRMWWAETAGSGVEYKNKFYSIDYNVVQIIPPNTAIKHILKNPVNSLSFHFSLGQPYDAFAGKIIQYSLSREKLHALSNIANAFKDYDAMNQISLKYSFQIYSIILRALSSIDDNEWPMNPMNQYVCEAILLMEKSLSKTLNNETIARKLGLSVNSFVKLFKNVMGIAPQKHLQYRRLESASIELIHSNKPIEEIAENFAFCDRHYFSRQFKKRYGIGPAAYRKELV